MKKPNAAPAERAVVSKSSNSKKPRASRQAPFTVFEMALADLARSGLTVDDAAAMQIAPGDPEELRGLGLPSKKSYEIPYFDIKGESTGFRRWRYLEDTRDALAQKTDKKPIRYVQERGTRPQMYLAPMVPWEATIADTSIPIGATEGEKKAAAMCAAGIPCIGLGGVWSFKSEGKPIPDLDLFDWRDRQVYIAYDSDAKTNPDVAQARSALAAELTSRGARVHIVDVPDADDGAKQGVDDVLVKGGVEALSACIAAAVPWTDSIEVMNSKHAVVMLNGKCWILTECLDAKGAVMFTLSTPNDMRHKYANVQVAVGDKQRNLFDLWMTSPRRRSLDGIVFDPTGMAPPNYHNIWRGFAVDAREGDCSLFLAHAFDVMCSANEALFEWLMAFLADAVQNPGRRPGTAIVFRGKQGTGKSLFVSFFLRLLGIHAVTVTNSRHLVGNFNDHLKYALVIHIDEGHWGGDKATEGTIKALVTEPVRMVESKGKDAYPIDNYARLLFTTNHDWAVPAGLEERRFLVVDVSDVHMQDHAYFKALSDQMEHGGLEALMHHLMNLDISGVNLRAIPKTRALTETKVLSMTPVQRFWFDCLERGTNSPRGGWCDEVECDRLYDLYAERSTSAGVRHRSMQTELGMALKKLVPGLARRRPVRNGAQSYVWRFPSLEDCRTAMSEAMRCELDWDDTGDTPSKARSTRSRK